jgi:hypothetical protein
MLDPQLATQLRNAGLPWSPAERDVFMLPDSELGVFTVSDRTTLIQQINGQAMVTFHGVVEWALDSVMLTDVVWLPSETQLREAIQLRLGGDHPSVQLRWDDAGMYRCTVHHFDQTHPFEAHDAETVYAQALLFVLGSAPASNEPRS